MKTILMAALATAATVSFASPAFAGATLVDQTGKDLAVRIYTSQDDPAIAPNVGTTVFANAGDANATGHNTSFTGYSQYDIATQTGTLTTVDIKDGGGFAQLNDHDFSTTDLSTQNLFAVVMDIANIDFTAYEFTVMLGNLTGASSSIDVYYMMTGDSGWTQATGSPLPTGGNANQFILTADGTTTFDKVLIVSTGASIEQIKQNLVNLAAGAVPEPATWAMMLLGFGGIGMTMRRRRSSGSKLAQLA